jgi:alpha-galactosidase
MDAASSYTTMRDALHATSRPIVFSICEWGDTQPWLWAPTVGHSWRTTGDIVPCWNCEQGHGNWASFGVLRIVDMQATIRKYSGPGHWNDMDMLEVGNGLTEDEDHAHFTLWSMMDSPLIAGNDLRAMTASVRATLANRDVIALGQDALGVQAFRALADGELEIWAKPLAHDEWAVAFLNRGEAPLRLAFDWKGHAIGDGLSGRNLATDKTTFRWTELWSKTTGSTAQALDRTLPPHSLLVYRLLPGASASVATGS